MSDFFSSLVERVQASAPAITPRRASRFESPGELLSEPLPSVSRQMADPPSGSGVAPERPTLAPPGEGAMPRPMREPVSAAPPPRPVLREPAPTGEPNATRVAPSVNETPSVTTVTHVHAHTTVLAPRADVALPPPEISDDRARVPTSPSAAPVSERRPAPTESRTVIETPPPRTTVIPRIERIVVPPNHEPAAAIPARDRPDDEPPRPPRIEVTIGTVEVRAIVPPPAPPVVPRANREPPRLPSLDDYLKKRRVPRA